MGYTPPYLEVRKVAGGWSAYGPSHTAGDTLTIYSNTVDGRPRLVLTGGAKMELHASTSFEFNTDAATPLTLSYSAPDTILDTYGGDHNLFLKPNGTGKVKFGTYVPGLVVSTGTIPMLDAAGNARNILVQS
jgi:hypothetical protein